MKDNKKNQTKNYVVVVFDWINGVLNKTKNVFSSLKEAETFVDNQTEGDIKLYNAENQIIKSENKNVKYAKIKKDKPGKKDHDDDDDYN
jgi:hypothetical protein